MLKKYVALIWDANWWYCFANQLDMHMYVYEYSLCSVSNFALTALLLLSQSHSVFKRLPFIAFKTLEPLKRPKGLGPSFDGAKATKHCMMCLLTAWQIMLCCWNIGSNKGQQQPATSKPKRATSVHIKTLAYKSIKELQIVLIHGTKSFFAVQLHLKNAAKAKSISRSWASMKSRILNRYFLQYQKFRVNMTRQISIFYKS